MRNEDVIDSRDLLKELRELVGDSSYDYSDDPTETPDWSACDTEDRERIEMLRGVLAELPESTVDSPVGSSWGSTLVHEDYFTKYAEELAEDIGAINRDASWPLSYIDWEAAAEALKQDYTTVEIDGSTYYAR